MEEIKVEKIIISKQGEISENYQQFLKLIKSKNVNVMVVKKGDRVKLENNVYFDILWPTKEQIKDNILNNNSIVAKLTYNDFSMLFTGDIEKIVEEQIISKYKNSTILHSTVLKVAHHGSKTSSIKEFVEAVNPKIALIGVGANNTFGHPNEGVIERLKNLRCENF